MNDTTTNYNRLLAGFVLLMLALLAALPLAHAANAGGTAKQVASEALPNVPGKTLTAVVVNYPPGGQSPQHHHAGSVFAYVLSGAIRSQVSEPGSEPGPARVYKAGDSFFESPGSEHRVSANASDSEPASLLAIFVADDSAKLTTFDK